MHVPKPSTSPKSRSKFVSKAYGDDKDSFLKTEKHGIMAAGLVKVKSKMLEKKGNISGKLINVQNEQLNHIFFFVCFFVFLLKERTRKSTLATSRC